MSKFAIQLAKEVYFGKEVMAACTMMGTKLYHPLPKEELPNLKDFLHQQTVPATYKSTTEWEHGWKECWEGISQNFMGCVMPDKLL